MQKRVTQREGPICADGGVLVLSCGAAGHLHAAMEQMELLLRTEQVDAGLVNLVEMLRHLRAIQADMT